MSITHHHICGVVNSELRSPEGTTRVRILDKGFGDGRMLGFLQAKLPELNPGLSFEIHGFDVHDSRVQQEGFLESSLRTLKALVPGVDWSGRLSMIGSSQPWPYPDGFFDVVVSNQVLEHVTDHDAVLGEIRRVLRDDGVSVHLFPLGHYLLEGHLHLPGVHWIRNSDLLEAYIRACSRVGLGIFGEHRKADATLSADDFSREHADYMVFETNYLTLGELYRLTKRNGFRASFRYTPDFYWNKVRQILRQPLRYRYGKSRVPLLERILFSFLVRVSSVTLVLEKRNRYRRRVSKTWPEPGPAAGA